MLQSEVLYRFFQTMNREIYKTLFFSFIGEETTKITAHVFHTTNHRYKGT